MVDLLALAHDRGCGAELLADLLAADLEAGRLPDMSAVCAHFAPDPARLPHVVVHLVPLTTYEDLLGLAMRSGGMKTTQAVDSARISLLLNELRLPAIKLVVAGR